jgi:hypothetical protein
MSGQTTVAWIGVVLGLVIGIGALTNPPTGETKTTPQSHDIEQQTASEPLPLQRWHSVFDGVEIACFQSGESRGFVTLPTNQQIWDGAVVIQNSNPSDEAWSKACSKQQ